MIGIKLVMGFLLASGGSVLYNTGWSESTDAGLTGTAWLISRIARHLGKKNPNQ